MRPPVSPHQLDTLVRALHEGTYETVVGPITFDAKGDNPNYRYRMHRWRDATYEEVGGPRGDGG